MKYPDQRLVSFAINPHTILILTTMLETLSKSKKTKSDSLQSYLRDSKRKKKNKDFIMLNHLICLSNLEQTFCPNPFQFRSDFKYACGSSMDDPLFILLVMLVSKHHKPRFEKNYFPCNDPILSFQLLFKISETTFPSLSEKFINRNYKLVLPVFF